MNKSVWHLPLLALMVAVSARADYPEFTKIIRKASPAVVNIKATRTAPHRLERLDDDEAPEFFRRFFRGMPDGHTPDIGAGSGLIIESNGYILTNNHIVEGADEIMVALSDRREREAEIIGKDAFSDLALLKIDAKDLPTVNIGSSKTLEVGQWVLAIGSPFGFEHSVTAGIVSAKGRSLPENNGNYVSFIQTDVAINPGNSGGPLLDMNGRVVGINSQIFTHSGGFMGLSFAIPIDIAMEVVEQLREKGSVSRGWLGVLIQRVDRDLAESFGLDRPAGALVTQVLADSPAESAGLRKGDIILAFNGQMIDLSSDLPHLVGRTRVESEALLEIMRNGERKKLEVIIGKLDEESFQNVRGFPFRSSRGNRIGIEIDELEDSEKTRLDIDHGVRVSRVFPGAANDAGVERGDIITDLDGVTIKDADQFGRLVNALPDDITVHARVVRFRQPQYLAIRIPAE